MIYFISCNYGSGQFWPFEHSGFKRSEAYRQKKCNKHSFHALDGLRCSYDLLPTESPQNPGLEMLLELTA